MAIESETETNEATMDYEQLSIEQVALMEHMGTRGVSRKDGAYIFARTIGDMLAAFCDDDDDKALVLASLVRVARIQAGLPAESH